MRVIVTAGGTGGHICPALAIINKIKEKDKSAEILYIGTTDRMEKDIIPSKNIKYIGIEMKGLQRKNVFKNFSVFACFRRAIKKSKDIIEDFKPDVVLGIGGYITLPVIYAAHKLGIKTFIHEQNSIPGLSNKILNRYADVVGVSLSSSLGLFDPKKVVFTGNPRSEEVINERAVDKAKYGLSDNKKLVLIIMGSLGSKTMNEKLRDTLPLFSKKDYEILLVTGKDYYNDYAKIVVPKNVKVVSYLDDMLRVLKKTDLIVTRAGASTISEITALGIPAIFVPSPYVTHNHQEKNALVLERAGAAIIIKESDFDSKLLLDKIDNILNDNNKYKTMKENSKKLGVTDSASKIYDIVKELATGE